MMRPAAVGMIAFLLLACVFTVAAKTEYRYTEGKCPTGEDWWCVVRYEDGIPTYATGVSCSGYKYYTPLSHQIVAINPTAGLAPAHTGPCESAAAPGGWSSVIRYDDNNKPSWMGGQACDGSYWVVTDFTNIAGPGGE